MRLLLNIALLLAPALIFAQETIQFNFKNNLGTVGTGYGITVVCQYTNDIIYYRGKPYMIRLPQRLKKETTGFGLGYFTGWENAPIEKNTLIVLENYKSDSMRVYVDYNHNLDISDDGEALKPDADGKFRVVLKEL